MEFKKLIEDEEHKINMGSFSIRKLQNLYSKEHRKFNAETGQLNDFTDAKKYMVSHLYPVEGGYMLNACGVLEFKSSEIISKTYFKPLNNKEYKELKEWFLSVPDIYTRVCIPSRQLIKDDTINTIGAFKHNQDMKYDECTEEQKRGVRMMLNFIKTVWASEDEEQYKYIIGWISNMIHGNKNQMLLYAKSTTEGIGKSTLTEFLMDHVIGRNLSIQPSSDVLTTGNNNSLFGKLFVCFEELKSSKAEWAKMSSCLKEWITSDTIAYSEKYMVGYTAKNINNYIINTNTEAVKGAGGRRYFICELSTKYKGMDEYWDELYSTCFDDDVGKAFYLYMMEYDISKFKSNKPPTTAKKKEYISELLSTTYKFIKFNYLLCNRDIKKVTVSELYGQYESYCENTGGYKHGKMKFNAELKELGFNYKMSNSKSTWTITVEELKTVATRHNWYHELDNDNMKDNVIWEGWKTVAEVAQPNMFESKEYEDIIEAQAKEIQELKKQLEALKKKSKSKSKPKKEKKTKKVVKSSMPTLTIGDDSSALSAFLNM